MLLPWVFLLLAGQLLKSAYHAEACVARFDDIVYVSV
jgi:hypothetical protein